MKAAPLTRRRLLTRGPAGAASVFGAEAPPAGDVLIFIFLRGGMDGLQAAPPYADPALQRQRPTLAMRAPGRERACVDLDGHFGLHPALAPLKELFDEGALAVIQGVGSPDSTLSHFEAMQTMERGVSDGRSTATGWIARHLLAHGAESMSPLRAVVFDRLLPKSMQGALAAMALPSLKDFSLRTAGAGGVYRDCLWALYPQDDRLLQRSGAGVLRLLQRLEEVRRHPYRPSGGAAYPEGSFGSGLRQAAQLIKADIGLEIAQVDLGGWDSHAAQDVLMQGLMEQLSSGIHAFARDLGDSMQRVTLVALSEFGRRVHENSALGTDHGRASAAFVLGGGIRGGKVYGAWPGIETKDLDADGNVRVTVDYRDILTEIVRQRLKNERAELVFPGFTPRPLGLTRPA